MDRQTIFRAIDLERSRQEAKFGPVDTCANYDLPPGFKLCVLSEEVGEVARLVCDDRHAKAGREAKQPTIWDFISELVQVAAVAVAWLESLPDPDA